MINHFHLIVTTPLGNLSEFMQQLQGRFAQYYNWRHKRVGHLFGGRFRAPIVENDLHLLTVASYVFMNPVKAGLVARMEDWKWSTYAASTGLAPVPSYLSLTWIERLCPGTSREESQRTFRELMLAENPIESYLAATEPAFGSPAFRRAIRGYIGERLYLKSVPRSYRAVFRPSLAELIPAGISRRERSLAIQRAHVVYGYRLQEIARSLGVHPSTVGRMAKEFRRSQDSGSDPD